MKKLLILLSVLILSQFLVGRQSNSKDFRLVGSWHFNKGTGSIATDSSGRGHHGVITNGAWVTGKYSEAIYYDDSAYVTVPDHADFTIASGQGLTLCAWFKMTATQYGGFISNRADDVNGSYGLLTDNNDKIMFHCFTGIGSTAITSVNTLNDGEWYFAVGVRENDGATMKLYIDGLLSASGSQIGSMDSQYDLCFGTYYGSDPTAFEFEGTTDETSIYNAGLTQGEVTKLYRDYIEEGKFIN